MLIQQGINIRKYENKAKALRKMKFVKKLQKNLISAHRFLYIYICKYIKKRTQEHDSYSSKATTHMYIYSAMAMEVTKRIQKK